MVDCSCVTGPRLRPCDACVRLQRRRNPALRTPAGAARVHAPSRRALCAPSRCWLTFQTHAHTHTHTHTHTHPPLVPAPACARSALHCAVLRCAAADLLPGGERAPRLLPSEQMLAYHGNARFSVESGGGHPGLGGSHYGSGRAFVSNQRLVFVTSPAAAHFVGFEVPLLQVGQGATAGAYVRRPRERG